MTDNFDREINYLRISVTDRCNLRCLYCMPEEGIDEKLGHDEILSLEEYARIVRAASQAGIRKVRLTGGEPLVRKNFVHLIRLLSEIPKIDDIAVTTNGILFAGMAKELKEAGLTRINISLDSLDAEKYRYITRLGNLGQVKTSIYKALELGLEPVKINTVVIKGFNDDEITAFAQLAHEFPLHIRFIEFMPIGDLRYWKKERMMNADTMKSIIEKEYALETTDKIPGNGPARYYKTAGGRGSIGFISPMSNHFCAWCNRIRMTADGMLRGCLYDKKEIDLKPALSSGSDEEILKLIIKTIKDKPARHMMNDGWGMENERKMYQIGG